MLFEECRALQRGDNALYLVEHCGREAAVILASCMCLISILCLVIICYAFGSRMELQNVLPSTEARLFYLWDVNPMNRVTALQMTNLIKACSAAYAALSNFLRVAKSDS